MARSYESKQQEIRDRAFSKVLWGESDIEVYRFLKDEGLEEEGIESLFNDAHRERSATIRKRSLVKIIFGIIGIVGSVAGVLIMVFGVVISPLGLVLCVIVFLGAVPFTIGSVRDFISGKTTGSALFD